MHRAIKNWTVFLFVLVMMACSKKTDSPTNNPPTTSQESPSSTPPKCASSTGTTWVPSDDFSYTNGAWARGAGGDSKGNIFAVGQGLVSGVARWIVRKGSDSGTNWTTLDDFQYVSARDSIALAVAFDLTGAIFVTGIGIDSSGTTHWLVRKSTDGGSTWNTVEDFQLTSGKNSYPWAVKVDSSGNIFVAGEGFDSSNGSHWLIRKSTNAGSNWTTVENFSNGTAAQSLVIDSGGKIYAGGYGNLHAFVRRSSDGGTTWATSDDFQYAPNKASYFFGMGLTSKGVFAVGQGIDSTGAFRWISRKSNDSSGSWTTIDDFVTNAGATSVSFLSDTNEALYAAGYGPVPSGTSHWLVRRSTDNGGTWSTIDDFQYANGSNSNAFGSGIDSNGNLFVAGRGDANGIPHWIVRRSRCQ